MVDANSVRGALLFRRRLLQVGKGRGEVEEPGLVGELPVVEQLAGLGPVLGREGESGQTLSVGRDSDAIAEVLLGVEAVEPGRGDQRHDGGGALRVAIAAGEQPGRPADRDHPFILPMSAQRLGSPPRSPRPGGER